MLHVRYNSRMAVFNEKKQDERLKELRLREEEELAEMLSKKYGIDQIYASIQDELRSQYSLGYVSDKPVVISEFRKIQLTVKRPGLVVQSRDRYWAEAPARQ